MPEIPIKNLSFEKSNAFEVIVNIITCYPDTDLLKARSAILFYTPELFAQKSKFNFMDSVLLNAQRGSIAGDILTYLYMLDYYGETASLREAFLEVKISYDGAKEENRKRKIGWSEKKIKEAWKVYKPVAPLWAALRRFDNQNPFLNPDTMIKFFLFLEAFADFGEKLQIHKRQEGKWHPLFQKGEVWRLPPKLKKLLPKTTITPPPLR